MLLGLIVLQLGATLFAIYNNSFRSAPIFLFLLVLGTGGALILGLMRGGVLALIVLVVWIAIKRSIGIWSEDRALMNLGELFVVASAFLFSGFFGLRLSAFLESHREISDRLEKFHLEDRHIGLIKQAIGRLRLREEEERSVRYRRPFSLVLVQAQPNEEVAWESAETVALMRAVANVIKVSSRRSDIPFLDGPTTIALILPETNSEGASRVVRNLMQQMLEASYQHPEHGTLRLQKRLQVRYGFAAFLGASRAPIDMMDAAQRSLQKGIEHNWGLVYQNVFIEWEEVGEMPISVPLVGGRVWG